VSGGLEELFFNRVERAETWRMAANRFFFLTGLTRLTGLG
jgi:hypothetical protein